MWTPSGVVTFTITVSKNVGFTAETRTPIGRFRVRGREARRPRLRWLGKRIVEGGRDGNWEDEGIRVTGRMVQVLTDVAVARGAIAR